MGGVRITVQNFSESSAPNIRSDSDWRTILMLGHFNKNNNKSDDEVDKCVLGLWFEDVLKNVYESE